MSHQIKVNITKDNIENVLSDIEKNPLATADKFEISDIDAYEILTEKFEALHKSCFDYMKDASSYRQNIVKEAKEENNRYSQLLLNKILLKEEKSIDELRITGVMEEILSNFAQEKGLYFEKHDWNAFYGIKRKWYNKLSIR